MDMMLMYKLNFMLVLMKLEPYFPKLSIKDIKI